MKIEVDWDGSWKDRMAGFSKHSDGPYS